MSAPGTLPHGRPDPAGRTVGIRTVRALEFNGDHLQPGKARPRWAPPVQHDSPPRRLDPWRPPTNIRNSCAALSPGSGTAGRFAGTSRSVRVASTAGGARVARRGTGQASVTCADTRQATCIIPVHRRVNRTYVRYDEHKFTDVIEGLLELSDDNLDGRIRAIESERRRLDAELAAAISVAERRQLPTVDGHRTINAYLRATINCSSSEASRLRGLSRAVDRVDGLGDAWFAGHIGQSQATRFSVLHGNRRVRDRLGEFAPLLLEKAEQLPYADFATCVDRFVARADTDGAHDEHNDTIEHRRAACDPLAG